MGNPLTEGKKSFKKAKRKTKLLVASTLKQNARKKKTSDSGSLLAEEDFEMDDHDNGESSNSHSENQPIDEEMDNNEYDNDYDDGNNDESEASDHENDIAANKQEPRVAEGKEPSYSRIAGKPEKDGKRTIVTQNNAELKPYEKLNVAENKTDSSSTTDRMKGGFKTLMVPFSQNAESNQDIPVYFSFLEVVILEAERIREQGDAVSWVWYRLRLRYGTVPYEWTIRRSYADLVKLHSQLALIYLAKGAANKLPNLPNLFFTDDVTEMYHIQDYLTKICSLRHEVKAKFLLCAFFECSVNSFIPGMGQKPKEGFIKKHSGGRRDEYTSSTIKSWFQNLMHTYHKKWMLISESFIAYYSNPGDLYPDEVLLCDQYFDVSIKSKLGKTGVQIDNGYRKFFFTCKAKYVDGYYDEVSKLILESEWCRVQRYGSFAPERPMTNCKFYIHPKDYYADVAEAILVAENTIFIGGWWISPEFYLRRPYTEFPESRLDKILLKKAEQGVRIYILIYKEIAAALSLDSAYTKDVFKRLHRNISVIRHPDAHYGNFKWAHHEKMVILDQKIAFLGGIDLCFGRYDDVRHLLTDNEGLIWPGKDYSNPLIADFFDLNKPEEDSIDRKTVVRLPWHDTALRVEGQAARDVARHFIGRWNFAKVDKETHTESIPFLVPRENFVTPENVINEPAHLLNQAALIRDRCPVGKQNVQILRSCGRWSGGIFTETSIMAAYVSLIQQAQHFILIENQIYITNTSAIVTSVCNKIGLALFNRIKLAHEKNEEFRVFIILPLVPAFQGEPHDLDSVSLRKVMEWQYKSICRDNGNSLIERLINEGINPESYISFHGLRTFDCRTYPVPPPQNQQELRQKELNNFANTEIRRENDELTQEEENHGESQEGVVNIENHAKNHAENGRNVNQEEKEGEGVKYYEQYVTSQIYVHSKCCIIDDDVAIIGSANINDRSMLGNRDSEIAAIVTEDEKIDIQMCGKPFKASRIVHELRCSLFREYLGIKPEQKSLFQLVEDPLSQNFLINIWFHTSRQNTRIFRTCFRCLPDNSVTSYAERDAFVQQQLLSFEEQRSLLKEVRGFLVDYPLNFLEQENLGEMPLLSPESLVPIDVYL